MSELAAIVLIAHGSRHEEANLDTRLIVRELAKREPGRIVREAFLELAQPNIDSAAAECVRAGPDASCCCRISFRPAFMFSVTWATPAHA